MQTRRDFLKLAGTATVAFSFSGVVSAQNPAGSDRADINGPHSLRAHAETYRLLVGCAVVPQRLNSERLYAGAVAEQANILVAENAMKWAALRPAPDRFDFRAADD